MAKRHHSSKREMSRSQRSYSSVSEHRDKFNDEIRHDKDTYKMGPYKYDRQEQYRSGMAKGEYYAGAEPRRRQEMEDAGMIHEDPRAVANLPQNVMMNYYPKDTGSYLPEDLDDTLRGVDRQMSYDNKKKMDHFYPK